MKKKLRAGPPGNILKHPDKPHCVQHKTEMRFEPGRMLWECTARGCPITAFPNRDTDGKPIVGVGDLELLIVHDDGGHPHMWLIKAVDNNVLIDVTAVFSSLTDGFTMLGIPTVRNLDADGNLMG